MAASASFDDSLALSRFGLGSGPEGGDAISGRARQILADEIRAGGPRLVTEAPLPDTPELLARQKAYYVAVRDREKAPSSIDAADTAQPPLIVPANEIYMQELDVRFNGAYLAPDIGFNERMVMFWANHFAVSTDKNGNIGVTAGAFEREAIRPNIFGRFKDLLLSVETHPCMLMYLDNQDSIGPDSAGGRKSRKGLNENLAREIMELHILGVGSGYTQADVTSFAAALTGWTYTITPDERPNDPMPLRDGFKFAPGNHQPGSREVLGRTYRNDGFFQATDIMLDLAERPACARFIALKLAQHFVSDSPPQSLVDRLADVFQRTDGDLGLVSHALIESPEAWSPACDKMRLPQEYLIAMMRATGVTLVPISIDAVLGTLGERMWRPGGPNGYSDRFDTWATPPGLFARMEAANRIGRAVKENVDPRLFAQSLLGPRLSETTLAAISQAENARQGLSLAFMSPEFMRR